MKYLVLLISVFLPLTAFASFHNYTCADGLSPAGSAPPSCGSTNVYTYPGGGTASMTDNTPVYSITNGTTYFITYTATAGGVNDNSHAFQFSSMGATQFVFIQSGTNSEVSSGSFTGTSGGGLIIRYDSSNTISNICIDNDGTSCTAGPAAALILGLVRAFWIN